MREKKDRQAPASIDMRTLTLTLTVSVFIALLAFFIVLNSFGTNSSSRMAHLKSSLNDTFGFIGKGRSLVVTQDEGAGSAGDAEEAAAAGLRSVLPDIGFQSAKTADGGRIMVVNVQRDDLEERWPELRARIANVLTTKNPGGKHSIQLLALDGPQYAAQLVPMAQELTEEGVDADLIAVGYQNRGQAAIELRFLLAGGS